MHNDIMPEKISAVINTLNEERNIRRAIDSIKWVDEIIVCDMHSDDNTVQVAKKLGAKVISHDRVNFVEPARNFAISKAHNPWVLVLDPDEEVSKDLAERLKEMATKPITADFVEIPRKNIIFGKWIKSAGWWPDYQIRFFKKGAVVWQDQIHSKPDTRGTGLTLPEDESFAIVHNNYQSISQFITRMNRYTNVEARQLKDQGYIFDWKNLIEKPLDEFLSRFFSNKGYKDGLHGLALSLLQAFSFLVVHLKLWELSRFKEEEIKPGDVKDIQSKLGDQLNYWVDQTQQKGLFKNLFSKLTKN